MPPRQLWLFKFGCWLTIATAVLHLAVHLAGPPAPSNDTEQRLWDLATTYRFALAGGAERSLMDMANGFSLIVALLLATLGGIGLIVEKRAHQDRALMSATARMMAVSAVVMLGISLTNFFIVPSLCLAMMAVCFIVASVEAPRG
jgi:hypothetical protein